MSLLNENPVIVASAASTSSSSSSSSLSLSLSSDPAASLDALLLRMLRTSSSSSSSSAPQQPHDVDWESALDALAPSAFEDASYHAIRAAPSSSPSSSPSPSSPLPTATPSPTPLAAAITSRDAWDDAEVFELVRHINDPEHPLTLEQLNVAQRALIKVDDRASHVDIHFTPTIPHCSMATLIGLCLRVKLLRSLPTRFKVDIAITPGTHASEDAINKQLNDKERVAAALENHNLLDVVHKCIANADRA